MPLFKRNPDAHVSRGQAMVEFALILPLLALLLVMAIDFGRVFFGWVAVTNVSRVGASYAALNADAWDTPGDAARRSEYLSQMQNDAQAINCTLPAPLPQPVFSNVGGSASPREVGDRVTVSLTCQFSLITPLANGLFGGSVGLGAESVFPVRSGVINGAPVGPMVTPAPVTPTPAPTCTVPQFVGTDVSSAQTTWTGAGFGTSIQKSPNNNSWSYIGVQSQPAGSIQPCATTFITLTEGTPPATPTPTPSATVTPSPSPTPIPQCTVPSFSGDPRSPNNLRNKWQTAGFVGNNLDLVSGNWDFVGSQTLVAGSKQTCATAEIRVGP